MTPNASCCVAISATHVTGSGSYTTVLVKTLFDSRPHYCLASCLCTATANWALILRNRGGIAFNDVLMPF